MHKVKITVILSGFILSALLSSLQLKSQDTITVSTLHNLIDGYENRITDSLEVAKLDAEHNRKIVYEQIALKKLNINYICGSDSIYCKSGLYDHFVSQPYSLNLRIKNRDEDIIKLEDAHARLYLADKKIKAWNLLLDYCNSLKAIDNIDSLYASYDYNGHTNLNEQILASFSSLLSANIKLAKAPFKIDKAEDVTYTRDYSYKEVCPIKDLIIAAYPYDGQTNFYKKEIKDNLGFMLLDGGNSDLYRNNNNIKMKWSLHSGSVYYTNTRFDYLTRVLYYKVPVSTFESNHVYKLEMVSLDTDSVIETPSFEDLNRFFYYIDDSFVVEVNAEYKVLYTMYFRVSQYETITDKFAEISDTLDVNKYCQSEVVFSEGLTQQEFDQDLKIGFSKYNCYEDFNNIHSKAFYYYMNVPDVNHLKLKNGELVSTVDHTLNKNFLYGDNKAIILNYYSKSINSKPSYSELDVGDSTLVNKLLSPAEPIDQFDYEKGLVIPKQSTLLLTFNHIKLFKKKYDFAKEALINRISDRAEYFKSVDSYNISKEGKLQKFKYYKNEEMKRLHPDIAKYIDKKFNTQSKDGALYVKYRLHNSSKPTMDASYRIAVPSIKL